MGRIGLRKRHVLKNAEEMIEFGQFVASTLPKPSILALSGELGAGKTTFVQGLAKELGIQEPIQSPTFILLNVYQGLAHFDLYRLKNVEDFLALGFEEYFSSHICAIEWSERIRAILPLETIYIHFEYDEGGRIANIS